MTTVSANDRTMASRTAISGDPGELAGFGPGTSPALASGLGSFCQRVIVKESIVQFSPLILRTNEFEYENSFEPTDAGVVARTLATELRKWGCYNGPVSNKWGARPSEALRQVQSAAVRARTARCARFFRQERPARTARQEPVSPPSPSVTSPVVPQAPVRPAAPVRNTGECFIFNDRRVPVRRHFSILPFRRDIRNRSLA
jgi:hypothetical protein